MFSPRRVRIVVNPCGLIARAASIASSIRSPGMNFTTERRTNAVFVARSRIQAFVDAARSIFLITDIAGNLTSVRRVRGYVGYAGTRNAAAPGLPPRGVRSHELIKTSDPHR